MCDGHFTQLVWKATSAVGCAISFGAFQGMNRCAIVACEYQKAGNMVVDSAFSANVLAI